MNRLRRPPPILLALLLAPLSLVLGYVGYRDAPDLALSGTDALYGALQLFTVGGVIPERTPWELDVARFLAPVAVVYAAVVAAVSLLRERAQRTVVAAVARRHVVVVGLGATGSLVALGLRRSGHSVVVLEIDPRNPRTGAARAAGVRVLTGDGTSRAHLERAQVDRASHVIVLSADDSRNLEIASVARQIVQTSRRREPVTLHVAITRGVLWRELDRLRLAEPHQRVTTEYVNLDDRTAQRLLAVAEEGAGGSALDWVLVDGDSAVATRTVAHVVRRALLRGVTPRVDLAAADGGAALLERLRAEEPWCLEHADLSLVGRDGPADAPHAPVALVCLVEADADAITRGLVLARQMPEARIVVAVYRPRSETTLTAAGGMARRIELVSAKFDALGRELLERSTVELMARVRHEDYLERERAKGSTRESNPSLVEWNELPDSLRTSNRRFAEAVGAAAGGLGGALVPLTGPVTDEELPVPAEVLEELARGEHDRWAAALEADGWRPTNGPKDPENKRHPLLVPWDQLSEAEREKDRDAFRAVPHMLARIGYTLVLPERNP